MTSTIEDLVAAAEEAEAAACALGLPDRTSIRVWAFADAPERLRDLSTNGGDEDWLAVVGPDASEPPWAETGTPFGWCRVERHELPGGLTVLIGCHA